MDLKFITSENEIYLLDEDGNKVAYVSFHEIQEGVLEVDHTVVSESLRGQGIAEKLMINLYEMLKQKNKKVVLTCSYAVHYFNKHEEKQDVLYK